MKNLKVDKVGQKFARQLSDLLFAEDFFHKTVAMKPATLREQINEVMKGAPPEIKRRLLAVNRKISLMDTVSDPGRKEIFQWGLTAGIAFSFALVEMARVRGDGPPDSPIHAYVRKIYQENPKAQKKWIVLESIERFEKEHPNKRHPSRRTLVGHFAAIIHV